MENVTFSSWNPGILQDCPNNRNYGTPVGVVDGGAVVPGVVGDATGGPVVPVNTVTVPVAAVPVVTGGTVETVDGVDGSGVVTVQRQQHNAII